jgi:hypothetical protein
MHIKSSLLRFIIFFGCVLAVFLLVYICLSPSSLSFPGEIITGNIVPITDDVDVNEEMIPGISSNYFSFPSTPLSSVNSPTPPISLTDTSMLIVSGLYTISLESMNVNPLRLLVEVDVANTAKLDAKNVQLDYEFRYNGNTVGRETIYCGIIAAGDVRSQSKTVFITFSENLFVRFRENSSGLTMHLVHIRVE